MSNLLNLELVSKSYGVRPLLSEVSLGVGEGDRIGIVGRNGDGKTTLLEVMTGLEEPDSGRVSRRRGLLVGYLHQGDELVDSHSVREAVLGGMADHEWAAATRTREVVEELLAGIPLDRAVAGLSGGERRRCSLAALLLGALDALGDLTELGDRLLDLRLERVELLLQPCVLGLGLFEGGDLLAETAL